MSSTIKRAKAIRADLSLWDGRNSSVSRLDASGGTITGLPVGTEVDVLQVYGAGTNRTRSVIADTVRQLGNLAVTLLFSPGTWSIDANLTIPSNFTCHIPRGCVFSVDSGKTLTFSGPLQRESDTWYSGAGTVAVAPSNNVLIHRNEVADLSESIGILGSLERTAAEIAASITPSNYAYVPGDARRYGAAINGVTNDTTAYNSTLLQAYQSGGADPFWPAGTAVVSNLTITASVRIRTAGYLTVLQQLSGLGDVQIINIQASNVEIDALAFKGNISTDSSEFHHCITVLGAAAISNVILRGAYGTNIRGDVINVAADPTHTIFNVKIGTVDGLNIYRNVLSITGGAGVEVDAVLGTQVGYRNFDIEPNSGSQTPHDIVVKYVRGAAIQFAGGSLSGGNGHCRVDFADLDNALLANSSPGYPSFPVASGNIGIIAGDVNSLHFGALKARGYQERLFNANANTIAMFATFDFVDISGCDSTETTFKNLFNLDAFVTLELNGGSIVLGAVDRYIAKGNGGIYRFKNLKISGGAVAVNATNGEFENLTINASSLASNLFGSCVNCLFKNITLTNAGSANFLINSTGNTLMHVNGTLALIESTGCSDNEVIHSAINGLEYGYDMVSGWLTSIAMGDANQTLTAVQSLSPSITTTGVLTAQRNLVVPKVPRQYTVFNNCTGFGVQAIASTGTGTVVAVGKRAIVQYDGTNVVRITPDT